MKKVMNITTCAEDLLRYKSNTDLKAFFLAVKLNKLLSLFGLNTEGLDTLLELRENITKSYEVFFRSV